jgi:hypothetical protein
MLLKNTLFRAYVINKYYDFKDVEDPLKTYVDDTIYEKADLYLTKKSNIFIRENWVTEYNSIWPWASPKEYKFYSVSKITSIIADSVEEETQVLAEFDILMDSQIDIYERKVYTVLDIFSDIGGIFEIFRILGGFLIIPFNKRAINIHIMNEMVKKSFLFNATKARNKKIRRNKIGDLARDESIK